MPTYPAATRPRRGYDTDGSAVFVVDGVVSTPALDADITELNQSSEGGGVAVSTNEWLAIVFPVRLTIDAMFLAHGGTSDTTLNVETSLNSTNGQDGTWASAGTIACKRGDTVESGDTWRADLVTGLSYNCRAIRVSPGTTRWQNWVIHGGGAAQDTPGLTILSSEYSAFTGAVHDWGRCARASSEDVDVYVSNTSTRDATGVVLGVTQAEDNDEFAVQHYLSLNKRDFVSQVYLGPIAAGSRSRRVTVRRVTPSDATVGARAARLVAAAAGWE